MFDSCFDVNSFVLREEIASRKSINEQANLALSPPSWPGSTRGSLQWISKYKVAQQISSSSKFILVTQKGIHTKEKFYSFFPVYNNSEILTDWFRGTQRRFPPKYIENTF